VTTRKFVLTSWCLGRQDGNDYTEENYSNDDIDVGGWLVVICKEGG